MQERLTVMETKLKKNKKVEGGALGRHGNSESARRARQPLANVTLLRQLLQLSPRAKISPGFVRTTQLVASQPAAW